METNSTPKMTVDIGGLALKNPVMTASGTFGYGEEFAPFVDLNRLGAIVVKGLSLEPRAGNPPPRIMETASGMLNTVGLENVGVSAFIRDKLPFLREYDVTVVANIFGETLDDQRFDRDILVIELSSDGSTWQPLRTYNRQELVYRLVEISPWHAGTTTLVGMDGKQDVQIRFRALDGMNGHEFLVDAIEVIADDASDNVE